MNHNESIAEQANRYINSYALKGNNIITIFDKILKHHAKDAGYLDKLLEGFADKLQIYFNQSLAHNPNPTTPADTIANLKRDPRLARIVYDPNPTTPADTIANLKIDPRLARIVYTSQLRELINLKLDYAEYEKYLNKYTIFTPDTVRRFEEPSSSEAKDQKEAIEKQLVLDTKLVDHWRQTMFLEYWNHPNQAKDQKNVENLLNGIKTYIGSNELKPEAVKSLISRCTLLKDHKLSKPEQDILKDCFAGMLNNYLQKIHWIKESTNEASLMTLSKKELVFTKRQQFDSIKSLLQLEEYHKKHAFAGGVWVAREVNGCIEKIKNLKSQEVATVQKKALARQKKQKDDLISTFLTQGSISHQDRIKILGFGADIAHIKLYLKNHSIQKRIPNPVHTLIEKCKKIDEQTIDVTDDTITKACNTKTLKLIKELAEFITLSNEDIDKAKETFTRKEGVAYSKSIFEKQGLLLEKTADDIYNTLNDVYKQENQDALFAKLKYCQYHILKEKYEYIADKIGTAAPDEKRYIANAETNIQEFSYALQHIFNQKFVKETNDVVTSCDMKDGKQEFSKGVVEQALPLLIEDACITANAKVDFRNVRHNFDNKTFLPKSEDFLQITGTYLADLHHYTQVFNGGEKCRELDGMCDQIVQEAKIAHIVIDHTNLLTDKFQIARVGTKSIVYFSKSWLESKGPSTKKDTNLDLLRQKIARDMKLAQCFKECGEGFGLRNFADALVEMKNVGMGMAQIKTAKEANQQLFFMEYRSAILSNPMVVDVDIKSIFSAEAVPDILNITKSKFNVDTLGLKLNCNIDDLNKSLDDFINKKDEKNQNLKQNKQKDESLNCHIRELVLEFSGTLDTLGANDISTLRAKLAECGIEKLTINSHSLDKTKEYYASGDTIINDNQSTLNFECHSLYNNNQKPKDEALYSAREKRGEEYSKKLLEYLGKNNNEKISYVHCPPKTEEVLGWKGQIRLESALLGKTLAAEAVTQRNIAVNVAVNVQQEVEIVQEQVMDLENDQDQDQYANKSLTEDNLIRRSNIFTKVRDGKVKIYGPLLKSKTEAELQVIWDKLFSTSQDIDGNTNIENRVDAISPDAATILLTNYTLGITSGGINLNYMPLGLFIFKHNIDGKDNNILDYNVNIEVQNDSALRQIFLPIKKDPFEVDDCILFDSSLITKVDDLKSVLTKKKGGSTSPQITDDTIKRIGTLFGNDKDNFARAIARIVHYGGISSMEGFLLQIETLKRTLGNHFRDFQTLFLSPIASNAESGFGCLLEKEPLQFITELSAFASDTVKGNKGNEGRLSLFFHLLKNTTTGVSEPKTLNINLIDRFKSFQFLLAQLEKLGVDTSNIKTPLQMTEGEDLKAVAYRMINIINGIRQNNKNSDTEYTHDTWKLKAQQIFNDMLKGIISLKERDAYHAVCIDKIRDLDPIMNIDSALLNKSKGIETDNKKKKLTYAPSLETLISVVEDTHSNIEEIKYSLLRHINKSVTKSQEDKINGLLQISTADAKQFLIEVDKIKDTATKRIAVQLFITLPPKITPKKPFNPASVKVIVDNIKGIKDPKQFIEIAKILKESGATFNDLKRVSKLYKQYYDDDDQSIGGTKVKDLVQTLTEIKQNAYEWKYFKRIIHNLTQGKKADFTLTDVLNKATDVLNKAKADCLNRKTQSLQQFCTLASQCKDSAELNLLRFSDLHNDNHKLKRSKVSADEERLKREDWPRKVVDLAINADNMLLWDNVRSRFSDSHDTKLNDFINDTDAYKKDDDTFFTNILKSFKDKPDAILHTAFIKYFLEPNDRVEDSKQKANLEQVRASIETFLSKYGPLQDAKTYKKVFESFRQLYKKFPNDAHSVISTLSSDLFQKLLYFQGVKPTGTTPTHLGDNFATILSKIVTFSDSIDIGVLQEIFSHKDSDATFKMTVLTDVNISPIITCKNYSSEIKQKLLNTYFTQVPADVPTLQLNARLKGIEDMYAECKKNNVKVDIQLFDDIAKYYFTDTLTAHDQHKHYVSAIESICKINDSCVSLISDISKNHITNKEDTEQALYSVEELVKLGLEAKHNDVFPQVMLKLSTNSTLSVHKKRLKIAKYFLLCKRPNKSANDSIKMFNQILECANDTACDGLFNNTRISLEEMDAFVIKYKQNKDKQNKDKAPQPPPTDFKDTLIQLTIPTLNNAEIPASAAEYRKEKYKSAVKKIALENDLLITALKEQPRSKHTQSLANEGLTIESFIDKHSSDPEGDRDLNFYKQRDDSELFLADYAQFLMTTGKLDDAKIFMDTVKDFFLMINADAPKNQALSDGDLKDQIRDRQTALGGQESPNGRLGSKIKLLGLLREAYCRSEGKFAYSSQLFPILYSTLMETDPNAQRMIAEVSTGQGKSLIVGLNAVIQAALGNAVHITSSTNSLSERDFHANQRFYDFVGVKSAFISSAGIKDIKGIQQDEYAERTIYHSTQSDLYFWISDKRCQGLYANKIHSVKKLLIADEVDAIMLDNKTLWRLATNSKQDEEFLKIYQLINEFFALNEKKFEMTDLKDESKKTVALELADTFIRDLEQDTPHLHAMLKSSTAGNDDLLRDKVQNLIASAHRVNNSTSGLVENKDYIVESITVETKVGDKIVSKVYSVARIMTATGEPDRGSQWGDGVQQLLHTKLNEENRGRPPFLISPENLSLTNGTTKQLLNYMDKLFGLTGTLGNEADLQLLNQKFGIQSALKLPMHQIPCFKHFKPIICSSSNSSDNKAINTAQAKVSGSKPVNMTMQQLRYITNICKGESISDDSGIDLKISRKKKQPMLIICENLVEAKALHTSLKEQLVGDVTQQNYQIITGEEDHVELEEKLALAKETGCITISTPFAGRGTDILVKDDSPLYVIETCVFPDRTSAQVIGRRGRNGQKGKNIAIINQHQYTSQGQLSDEDKKLDPQAQVIAIQENMNKSQEEYITKQIEESDLAEEIFIEFCHYKAAIEMNHNDHRDGEVLDPDVAKLANDMQNEYGNFMSTIFAYHKEQYKPGAKSFNEVVADPVKTAWKSFIDNSLLPKLKVRSSTDDYNTKSEKMIALTKATVAAAMIDERKKLTWKATSCNYSPARHSVTFDQKVYNRLGFSHHKETALDLTHTLPSKPPQHQFYFREQKDARPDMYANPILPKNAQFNTTQEHLIHMGNLLDSGYKVQNTVKSSSNNNTAQYSFTKQLINQGQIGFLIDSPYEDSIIEKITEAVQFIANKPDSTTIQHEYHGGANKKLVICQLSLDDVTKVYEEMAKIDSINNPNNTLEQNKDTLRHFGFIDKPKDIKRYISLTPNSCLITKQRKQKGKEIGKFLALLPPQKKDDFQINEAINASRRMEGLINTKKNITAAQKNTLLDTPSIIIPFEDNVAFLSINQINNGDINFNEWDDFVTKNNVYRLQNDRLSEHEKLTDQQIKTLFVEKITHNQTHKIPATKTTDDIKFTNNRSKVLLRNTTSLNNAIYHILDNKIKGNTLMHYTEIEGAEYEKSLNELQQGIDTPFILGPLQNDFVVDIQTRGFAHERDDDYSIIPTPENRDMLKQLPGYTGESNNADGSTTLNYTLPGQSKRLHFLSKLKQTNPKISSELESIDEHAKAAYRQKNEKCSATIDKKDEVKIIKKTADNFFDAMRQEIENNIKTVVYDCQENFNAKEHIAILKKKIEDCYMAREDMATQCDRIALDPTKAEELFLRYDERINDYCKVRNIYMQIDNLAVLNESLTKATTDVIKVDAVEYIHLKIKTILKNIPDLLKEIEVLKPILLAPTLLKQVKNIKTIAELNNSRVENFIKHQDALKILNESGKTLKAEYYAEVAKFENQGVLLIPQKTLLESRIQIIDDPVKYDPVKSVTATGTLSMVNLYYTDAAPYTHKNTDVNEHARILKNTNETLAQHTFDQKLCNIIAKALNTQLRSKQPKGGRAAFLKVFLNAVEYIQEHSQDENRYENLQKKFSLPHETVKLIASISHQIQTDTKAQKIMTGRVKNLNNDVKDILSNIDTHTSKSTAGMRIKDIRLDIITMAIESVKVNSPHGNRRGRG